MTTKPTTKEQILQAALACFSDKGYHRTTMDDIVAESGLSKGALYWHFKSKRELFIALAQSSLLEIAEEAAHLLTEGMTNAQKLRVITMFMVDEAEKMLPFFKLILDFWAQSTEDEQLQQMFDEMLGQFEALLAPIIEAGVAAGEFRPVNAYHVALSLAGLVDALGLYIVLLGEERIDLHNTVETMLDITLAGLRRE